MAIDYTRGCKVRPQSRAVIRQIALDIRLQLGFLQPRFPITDFLERLGASDEFDFDVCDSEDMSFPTNLGECSPDKQSVKIRRDVWDSACSGAGPSRFTVAHELGHLVLHTDLQLTRTMASLPHKEIEDSEWQADCFAGELLFPFHHFDLVKKPSEASKLFGISEKAAGFQFRVYTEELAKTKNGQVAATTRPFSKL